MDTDTLLDLTRRTRKDLLSSTENSAQSSVITLWFPGRKDEGRDSQGVWDGHAHTAVFNMENQQGPAVQHRGLCSMSHGSLDERGVWERIDTCICMTELLCCALETITTLLIGYAPIQNLKFISNNKLKKIKETNLLLNFSLNFAFLQLIFCQRGLSHNKC